MNIKTLEWKLGQLTGVAVFDSKTKEALTHARDLVASLRSTFELPPDFEAKNLCSKVSQLSPNLGTTGE